jgi:hypothetical protein
MNAEDASVHSDDLPPLAEFLPAAAIPTTPPGVVFAPPQSPLADLQDLVTQLAHTFAQHSDQTRTQIASLRQDILHNSRPAVNNPSNIRDSPSSDEFMIPDRAASDRRSTMFFGSPPPRSSYLDTPIQVLQADLVYPRGLNVLSLEGLQYLSTAMQELRNDYPGRQVQMSHMVAKQRRCAVIASWNQHRDEEAFHTGVELPSVLLEDWFSFNNDSIQAMILEACRPRSRVEYSEQLVLFLGKCIPQSPIINSENFQPLYYSLFMKSLSDMLGLYEIMSRDTTSFTINKHKMPTQEYGSRDSPGHIQCWLISLGVHKEAMLNYLGKDELSRLKTVPQQVKFVKAQLMHGRTLSQDRRDFDKKFSPVRLDTLRQHQGESHTRLQSSYNSHPTSAPSDRFQLRDRLGPPRGNVAPRIFPVPPRDSSSQRVTSSTPRSTSVQRSFAAMDYPLHSEIASTTAPDMDPSFMDPYDSEDVDVFAESDPYTADDHIDLDYNPYPPQEFSGSVHDAGSFYSPDTLAAFTDPLTARGAIVSAFRGYCSELYVNGNCSRRTSGCNFDHSPEGLARCTTSFQLLAARNLKDHGDLPPPFAPPRPEAKPDSWSRNLPPSIAKPLPLHSTVPTTPRVFGSTAITRAPGK